MQPNIAPQQMPPEQDPAMAAQDPQRHAILSNDPADDESDPAIAKNLEQHLNSIPDDQKAYLVQYLTPETQALVGIINGKEVFDYLDKFTDKSKTIQVLSKPQEMTPGQPQAQPMGGPQQAPQPQPPAAPQSPQPLSGLR